MKKPKISIIVPVFNSERYLSRAIQSCILQSMVDLEVVVVDDKGSDSSVQIVKDFMRTDSRIRLIDNQDNQGIYRAKRAGALAASGEYLMFLDPDDELELFACEHLLTKISANHVDFVYFNGRVYEDNKENIIVKNLSNCEQMTINEFLDFFIRSRGKWVLWLKIFKRQMYVKALEQIDKVDSRIRTNITEDALVFYFVLNQAKFVSTLNECFYKYYLHSECVSKNISFSGFSKSMQDYKQVNELIKKASIMMGYDKKFCCKYLARLKRDECSFALKYYKQNLSLRNIYKIFKYRFIKLVTRV